MKESKQYNISVSTNLKYINSALAMLLSLFVNHLNTRFDVHVYTKDSLSINTRLKFRLLFWVFCNKFSIIYLKNEKYLSIIDSVLKSSDSHLTSEAFMRLLIPYMNSAECSLYLDSDLIVLKNVNGLLNADISDKTFAAIAEGITVRHLENKLSFLEGTYINSGVLKMNLINFKKRFPDKESIVKIIQNWDSNTHPAHDQDIINDLFRNEITYLSPEYNVVSPEINNIKDPKIIHFTGGGKHKPWNFKCTNKFVHRYWRNRFWFDPVGFLVFYKDRFKYNLKKNILKFNYK
jgi:lipopolysaccharide biosynthesis glycosyltransferase